MITGTCTRVLAMRRWDRQRYGGGVVTVKRGMGRRRKKREEGAFAAGQPTAHRPVTTAQSSAQSAQCRKGREGQARRFARNAVSERWRRSLSWLQRHPRPSTDHISRPFVALPAHSAPSAIPLSCRLIHVLHLSVCLTLAHTGPYTQPRRSDNAQLWRVNLEVCGRFTAAASGRHAPRVAVLLRLLFLILARPHQAHCSLKVDRHTDKRVSRVGCCMALPPSWQVVACNAMQDNLSRRAKV